MNNSEFESTLAKIERQISRSSFKLVHHQYDPETFGNYTLMFLMETSFIG